MLLVGSWLLARWVPPIKGIIKPVFEIEYIVYL